MATFQQISAENTKRLNRLIDKGGVRRLKKMYEQAQAELETKLSKRFGKNAKTFTTAQIVARIVINEGEAWK